MFTGQVGLVVFRGHVCLVVFKDMCDLCLRDRWVLCLIDMWVWLSRMDISGRVLHQLIGLVV